MPSITYHLRTEHIGFLDEYADEHGLDNDSQALKAVLDDVMEDHDG